MIVLCMAAEIGGIIALSVYNQTVSPGLGWQIILRTRGNYFLLFYFDQIGDILHLGWKEVNQETKNIVQRQVSRYEETGFIHKGGKSSWISHIFDILFCFSWSAVAGKG